MSELKSLTLGGKTYSSFVDTQARAAIDDLSENAIFITVNTDEDLTSVSGSIISTSDKTWLEIQEAYLSFKNRIMMVVKGDGREIILSGVEYLEDAFVFSGQTSDPDRIFYATVTSASDIEISWSSPADSGGASTLIVTITDDVASHTSGQIYAHVQSGGTVLLDYGDDSYWTLSYVTESGVAYFSHFTDDGFANNITIHEDGTVSQVDRDIVTHEQLLEKITTPATAEVGQTIVVKSVDSNGKPIAWEAADLPSGGSVGTVCDPAGWELINSTVLTADDAVSVLAFSTDADGNSFAYDELWFYAGNNNAAGYGAVTACNANVILNKNGFEYGFTIPFKNFFGTGWGRQMIYINPIKSEPHETAPRYVHWYTLATVFSGTNDSTANPTMSTRTQCSSGEALKLTDFQIETDSTDNYMFGTFKLYGRNRA